MHGEGLTVYSVDADGNKDDVEQKGTTNKNTNRPNISHQSLQVP